jgi:phage terminase large subunit-like protein
LALAARDKWHTRTLNAISVPRWQPPQNIQNDPHFEGLSLRATRTSVSVLMGPGAAMWQVSQVIAMTREPELPAP